MLACLVGQRLDGSRIGAVAQGIPQGATVDTPALELARRKSDPGAALDRIEREADRLEALLADVLSLARLEAGQADFKRVPVALGELLTGIVQDADFKARAHGRSMALSLIAPTAVNGDSVLRSESLRRSDRRQAAKGFSVSRRALPLRYQAKKPQSLREALAPSE